MARKGFEERLGGRSGRQTSRHGRPHRQEHGDTRVGSLCKTCGAHFAKGGRKDRMLKTLRAETGMESLHAYLRKHHK